MYHEASGVYPDDLRRLVDENMVSTIELLSFHTDQRGAIPEPTTRPYAGPCDFGYIPLPADAPDDLVWAWLPPRFHGNEGAYVLYKSYDVDWLEAGVAYDEIDKTCLWLSTRAAAIRPAE